MRHTPTPGDSATILPFTAPRREPYLTKRQAAEYLGVSTRTIERRQRDDGLPVHFVHKLCRYRASELEAWVEEGRSGAEAPQEADVVRQLHRSPAQAPGSVA